MSSTYRVGFSGLCRGSYEQPAQPRRSGKSPISRMLIIIDNNYSLTDHDVPHQGISVRVYLNIERENDS